MQDLLLIFIFLIAYTVIILRILIFNRIILLQNLHILLQLETILFCKFLISPDLLRRMGLILLHLIPVFHLGLIIFFFSILQLKDLTLRLNWLPKINQHGELKFAALAVFTSYKIKFTL